MAPSIFSGITQTWRCGDAKCKTKPVVREVVGELFQGVPDGWIELQGKAYCCVLCAIRMLRFWRKAERRIVAGEKHLKATRKAPAARRP